MRAQQELLERELELERRELARSPGAERRELVRLYERRGVGRRTAQELATAMMRDPNVALETHAREELGYGPGETGKPFEAAFSSFATFAARSI